LPWNHPHTSLAPPEEYLLGSGRLESRDFDDLAFVYAPVAESAELAELARGELAERASHAERPGEVQGVFDVLEAKTGVKTTF
jgi:hypothetical protein